MGKEQTIEDIYKKLVNLHGCENIAGILGGELGRTVIKFIDVAKPKKIIFAKKLTKNQRRMLTQYESLCGFEPMHQEEFDAGEMTFKDLWISNLQWLESVNAEVMNIRECGEFD